jgi:hypothetical protein
MNSKHLLKLEMPQIYPTQLLQLTNAGHIPGYALERHLEETARAVEIRRGYITALTAKTFPPCQ